MHPDSRRISSKCTRVFIRLRDQRMTLEHPGNEVEELGPIFFNHQWDYDGITASNLNPVGFFKFLNRIENSITFPP